MKKTKKVILGTGIAALIVGAVALFGNSELFQGYTKLMPQKINPLIMEKPIMLVLFSQDKGYQVQISGDGIGVEAAIRVDHCETTGEGDKWCEFEYSDKNNNDKSIELVEDKDSFTLYGNSGYKYNIKVVDVTNSQNIAQSDRAVISIKKIKN